MTNNNSEKNNSKQNSINDTTSSRSNSGTTPDNKPKYRECFESYDEPKNK